MDKISEAENEDVDEILKTEEEPDNPDYKILERTTKILNERLEVSLANEQNLSKQLAESQQEISELKEKLNETNLNYEKKVQKLKSDLADSKKTAGAELSTTLKETMLQKDRKIRNLTTSVTLLKNFLFFVNNKAIKGLRTSQEQLKTSLEELQKTHLSDLETQKTSILAQIHASST